MKKIIKWGLLISWMIIIFLFSAQNGQESSETSGMIQKILALLPFIPDTIFGIELSLLVRKSAHFSEYAILYLLTYQVVKEYVAIKMNGLIALAIVFLYACSDELHQAFVPGRACMFTDVMIDTAGGAFMMLIVMLSNFIYKNRFADVADEEVAK